MSIKTRFIVYIVALTALSSLLSLFFFLFKLDYFTKESLTDLNSQYIALQGVSITVLIVVLGFLISFFLIKRLAGPIELFIKGTREVAKGNLDYQFNIKTGDEIEQLAGSFNQMIKSLKESHQQLKQAKDVLEVKIKARTKELEEQAEGLDEQVKKRTKELQERIDEMERLHRLTVDRELRMVELKQKIRELEKQANTLKKKLKSPKGKANKPKKK